REQVVGVELCGRRGEPELDIGVEIRQHQPAPGVLAVQDDDLVDAGDLLLVALAARRRVELATEAAVPDHQRPVGAERHTGIAGHPRGGRAGQGEAESEEEGGEQTAHAGESLSWCAYISVNSGGFAANRGGWQGGGGGGG